MNIAEQLYEISEIIYQEVRKVKKASFEEKELEKISLNHLFYLTTIDEIEDATISSIAEKMKITKPSVTIMINKLIAQGFVYKVQSTDDMRVFNVFLTEKGRLLVDADKKAYENVCNKLYSSSPEELKIIQEGISLMIQKLKD